MAAGRERLGKAKAKNRLTTLAAETLKDTELLVGKYAMLNCSTRISCGSEQYETEDVTDERG